METIDETTVRHIAELSRLSLSDSDVKRFGHQLNQILTHVANLPSGRLAGLSAPKTSLRLDDDVALPSSNPERLLANAVELDNGYVKVPAVLDKKLVS